MPVASVAATAPIPTVFIASRRPTARPGSALSVIAIPFLRLSSDVREQIVVDSPAKSVLWLRGGRRQDEGPRAAERPATDHTAQPSGMLADESAAVNRCHYALSGHMV